MADKVAPALGIQGKVGRLAHIVKQRRPAHHQLSRNTLGDQGGVGVDIIGMVGRMLVKVHHRLHFGNGLGDHRGKADQILGVDQRQQLTQLLKYPLPGQLVYPPGQGIHGFFRLRCHGQVEADGKPHPP